MTAAVSSLSQSEATDRLADSRGLALRTGPYCFRLQTRLPDVARAVRHLYADYPLATADDFVDFEVAIRRPRGWRAMWKSQVSFVVDGHDPFNPLPGDQGFPLLEWGMNYCVYGLCHQHLTLHSAVLERAGRALLLPAPSGSGKSTLCSGLLFNGWRLLSDELALIDPADGSVIPMPRPVSLKNESIRVLAAFAPQIEFGSQVSETTKGSVAHFRAPRESIQAAGTKARPGWIVVPRYVPGSPARLRPLERARALMLLVENAFNYDVFGPEGFELLAGLVEQSECFHFEYSDLAEATTIFGRMAQAAAPETQRVGVKP